MSYRVKIELILPNFGHVRLSRIVAVSYVDVLEILQVCAVATGDVAERVGTVAHLLETLATGIEESVTDWFGLTAFLSLETESAVIKYKQEGRWRIATVHRAIFQTPHTTLWPYLQACSNPWSFDTQDE